MIVTKKRQRDPAATDDMRANAIGSAACSTASIIPHTEYSRYASLQCMMFATLQADQRNQSLQQQS
jgi:hypothetical protein